MFMEKAPQSLDDCGAPFVRSILFLEPAGLGHFVLKGDGALEHVTSLDQAFVLAHQAVLMLDGENIVIPHQTQLADKVLPEQLVVAIADRAENPGTVQLVAIGPGVQSTVDRSV